MIRRLLMLNGWAALAAILNHAIWEVRPTMEAALQGAKGVGALTARLSIPGLIPVQLVFLLLLAAIPAFLLVSGIFIAISTPKQAKSIPFPQVLNRIKTLVVPYLLWTLAILAVSIAQGDRYTVFELLDIFLVRGVIGPYYYVPMLVCYLLLTPLLVPLVKTRAKGLLVGSLLLMLSLPALQYAGLLTHSTFIQRDVLDFFNAWRWLHNFFWYALGMVAGFHQEALKRLLQGRKRSLVAFLLLTLALAFVEMNLLAMRSGYALIGPRSLFFSQVYCLTFLLTYLAWSDLKMPFERALNQLGVMAYGLYLIHQPVQSNFNLLVERSFKGLTNLTILWIVVLFLVGLLVPVGLYQFVNRTPARRYSRFMFG